MSTGDRLKGGAQEIGGKIKEGVGKAVGNPQMVQEGRNAQVEGQIRQDMAKTGQQIKGAGEQIGGRVKSTVGAAVGNESLEGEGKLDELKGKVRQKLNE
jgi:uncharacterized protein YjbJ (UPF0337 family)